MFVIDASFKTYNNIDRSINAGVYTIGMSQFKVLTRTSMH